MGAKACELGRTASVFIVEIESGLTDANYFWMAGEVDQFFGIPPPVAVSFMGVNANRAIDLGKPFGHGQDAGEFVEMGRDGQHAADACRLRTCNDGVEFFGEIRKIQMTVAVDQHQITGST